MALCKLERKNYGGKLLVSIKYQNLHPFNEGLILLCQSILEMRRITHSHGSAHFATPLKEKALLLDMISHKKVFASNSLKMSVSLVVNY